MNNRYRVLVFLFAVSVLFSGPQSVKALESTEEEKTILQIGIWPPVQLASEDKAVSGLRLGVPYASNLDQQGYSLGFVNENTRDNIGIELGLVNLTGRDVRGLQVGLYNQVGRENVIIQAAVLSNVADANGGLQFSLVNRARLNKGLQLGLLNIATEVPKGGCQIGLINYAKDNDIEFMPLIRWVL